MDKKKNPDLMETILSTPQPTACSTVRVKKAVPRLNFDFEDSAGNSFGNSSLCEKKLSVCSALLEHQRILANESLFRSNQVAGLPSKYFRASDAGNDSTSSSIGIISEGTISDSDLLYTPKNTSTPRESSSSIAGPPSIGNRLSLQNLQQLALKLKSNVSLDNCLEEFNKSTVKHNIQIDSAQFIPGEEAESKIRSDELSWRRKNEMPIKDSILIESQINDLSKMSMGGYFQQKSDAISDLQEFVSPEKENVPVRLIDDATDVSTNLGKLNLNMDDKSLSVSAIARFLADTDETPRKLADCFEHYVANKGKKSAVLPPPGRKPKTDSSDDSELPFSKNSSYTSNFSENDALKQIVNKENLNTLNLPHHVSIISSSNSVSPTDCRAPSASSSRSSSSLSSLPEGKLPIETTRNELVWGCVKVNRCVTQEFLLRNRSSKSFRLQCSVGTHDFKIRKESRPDSDHLNAAKFVLRGHESRLILVSFIPTKLGPCVDEIVFSPLDSNLKQVKKQCIRLFGYGGHANVSIQNIPKDTGGKYLLSVGKLENRPILEQTFVLRNTGCVKAFGHIIFQAKQIFICPNIQVVPNFFMLAPSEEKAVTVVYNPSANDMKVLQQNFAMGCVADIGSLEVVTGAEINLFRLARLCRKCAEKNLPIDNITQILSEKIKSEDIPSDMMRFKENPCSLKEVLTLFNHDKVVLMVEQDPDQTLVPHFSDDSAMFQTLCHESTVLALENTVMQGYCRLEPNSVILTLPHKTKDILCLISETGKVLHFKTSVYPQGLIVSPSSGQISPGETVMLNIQLPSEVKGEFFKVVVYVDNEKFEVDVKVLVVNSSRANFLGQTIAGGFAG